MNDSIHQVLAELIGSGALDFKAAAGEVGFFAWHWPARFCFSKPYTLNPERRTPCSGNEWE